MLPTYYIAYSSTSAENSCQLNPRELSSRESTPRSPKRARPHPTSGGATECVPCPLGYHCAKGSVQPMPCDAGSLGEREGLASQAECSACPISSFCTSGVSEAEMCAAGRYGDTPNQMSAQCVGPCAAGHWCEAGSTSPTVAACEVGYFNPLKGAADPGACQPCGSSSVYCPEPGLSAPLNVDAGSISTPEGSWEGNRTGQTPQPPGFWCSAGKAR